MTVNYNLAVSSCSIVTIFKLLARWKGSIWKAIYRELMIWLLFYIVIAVTYHNLMDKEHQESFGILAAWISDSFRFLKVDFMLGFFVSIVVGRWSSLFVNVGMIEGAALTISCYVTGNSEQERIWRRNIIRYCVLAQVLVFRNISMQVRKRFPTIDTIVGAGFMMPHEREKFDNINCDYGKTWIPFQWANNILKEARAKGSIKADTFLDKCIDQVRIFRSNIATLSIFDWMPIPVMYPQIVFMIVHGYFVLALVGRQVLISDEGKVPWFARYFPIMPVLQFLFYMGWLKVAEALLNPLGEDDDDFETNFIIDRNLTVGLQIVDTDVDETPEQKKDSFWNDPVQPLYSEESAYRTINPLAGSTAGIELPSNIDSVTMVPRKDTASGAPVKRRISIKRNSLGSVNSSPTPDLKHRKPPEKAHMFAFESETINEVPTTSNGVEKTSGV